jgi:xanthine dehydrogenase YagT iron-sulfur-binding subunit
VLPTRRDFIAAALAAAYVLAMRPTVARAEAIAGPLAPAAAPARGAVDVVLKVNGQRLELALDPRVTLLDALREYAGLTGTKKGCDHGQCGACTVHVDGRRIVSCLTFAVMQQGREITTIEGLAHGDTLHPMQAAFIEHDGFQCGYCTPGQIMSAASLAREACGPSDADVRECMSGNLCRCGAYPNIIAAVQSVRRGGSASPAAAPADSR